MKLNELETNLNELNAQLSKATAEIIERIDDLETALADTDIPDEAAAVIGELKMKAQALDDLVPDEVPVDPAE